MTDEELSRKRTQFCNDCLEAGYSYPDRRWMVCLAYDLTKYDTFDKYLSSLHCTEDEWDLMEELGITYDD